MDHHGAHFWWLIFPVLGFGLGFMALWLRHRRQKDVMELLRTYATQGKEPPADLVKVLQNGEQERWLYRDWRRAILFAGLAVAFGVSAYLRHGPSNGLLVAAIVMVALALSYTVSALLLRKHDRT